MTAKRILLWMVRIFILTILYIPIWILGSLAITGLIPETPSEAGLVDSVTGMLILSILNTVLIISLIVSSRWNGWKLASLLALSYFGSFTFLTQIETWYFLDEITTSPALLSGLFAMGLSVPALFIPLAVRLCGKWKKIKSDQESLKRMMPIGQLILKLCIISVVYLVIYWCAGYFIAWQYPELRAFYGSPGEIAPFWEHTATTFKNTPGLIPFQLARGILFALMSIPIIRGSNVSSWLTSLLVALLLAVPHLVHILSNPLMPIASVRFSHMIETFTSTFVFGLIIGWLLQRGHTDLKELLGLKELNVKGVNS